MQDVWRLSLMVCRCTMEPQLAIDTMVSPLRRDGVSLPRSLTVHGASLETEGETMPSVVGPVWERTSGGAGV